MAARPRGNGFTLVETALALLVVAIGLMAVVGIFATALDAATTVNQEILANQFAHQVFGHIREAVNAPGVKWSALTSSGFTLDQPDTVWKTTGTGQKIGVNQSRPQLAEFVHSNGEESHFLKYRIKITDNVSDYQYSKNRGLKVRLEVWPGQFALTTGERALVFYTEIYNFGI